MVAKITLPPAHLLDQQTQELAVLPLFSDSSYHLSYSLSLTWCRFPFANMNLSPLSLWRTFRPMTQLGLPLGSVSVSSSSIGSSLVWMERSPPRDFYWLVDQVSERILCFHWSRVVRRTWLDASSTLLSTRIPRQQLFTEKDGQSHLKSFSGP